MYKKVIIILIFIIALLLIGIGYFALSPNDNSVPVNNTTTSEVNVTKIDNTTETTSVSSSGQYGYCAICGRALSYSEANNEYTQGKVCLDCAKNPYYYTDEGSQYANGKLEEAYPESYNGINNSN